MLRSTVVVMAHLALVVSLDLWLGLLMLLLLLLGLRLLRLLLLLVVMMMVSKMMAQPAYTSTNS